MISRIVGRLLKPSSITTQKRFWSSDYKGGNRGGGFFSRKDKPKTEKPQVKPKEADEHKESSHKTIRFLKKHEIKMKEIEPQPKK